MRLFRKKVPIKIIKTEPITKQDDSKSVRGAKPSDKSGSRKEGAPVGIKIDILGKQQLKNELSTEEWQAAAEQTVQEISRLSLPKLILKAQEARQRGRLDEAIIMLHSQQRRVSSTPEIEDELKRCMQDLENPMIFQRISNVQLAMILFDSAKFDIQKTKSLGSYLESRLTVTCENLDLRPNLEQLGMPLQYYCYNLAEFERSLDLPVLGEVQADFARREMSVNRSIHFVVCKESQTHTNWTISDSRISQGFTTIPLERIEVRQAITNDSVVAYLQNKINAWLGNFSLFATASPVAGQGEFFGRDRFSQEIVNWVNRGQSFYVLGNRRMGKTSLIRHLQGMGAFSRCLYAVVDLQIYFDDYNFDGAIHSLVNQWLIALQKRDRKLEKEISERVTRDMPAQERFRKFTGYLQEVRQKNQVEMSCLIIFDDANLFFQSERGQPNLWQNGAGDFVRSLHAQQETIITGITVWDFDTLNNIDRELNYFSGKDTVIYLGPLAEEECRTMIERIGGIINMRFEKESIDAIYRETGGHPYWTRLLCDSISSKRSSRYEVIEVNKAMVEKAASEFVSIHQNFRDQVLELLKPTERKILAMLGASKKPIPLEDFNPRLSLSEKDLRDGLTHLERYGWVVSSLSNEYSLRMSLLNRYYQILGESL